MKLNSSQAQWIGCDAAYGNDHAFLDGLRLPEGIGYFAATNSKERVFLTYPEMTLKQVGGFAGVKTPNIDETMAWYKSIAVETDEFCFEDYGITNRDALEKFYRM